MTLTKKQQIEHTAKELFWKHGFKKVSIDEICRKASVSRKTFYTLYENKTALVVYLFNENLEEGFTSFQKIAESDINFSEKMEKLLAYKFEATKNISMEFIADIYHPDAGELSNVMNNAIERSLSMMREFFQKAQAKGELNPEISIDYVIWLVQKSVEFCGNPELLALFPDSKSLVTQIYKTLIYGIMPVNNKD
jgi:AcrR family transcriptional regulator